MDKDTKMFLMALQMNKSGKMVWHGNFPKQIMELFSISSDAFFITLFGVSVERKPLFHE